MEGKRAGARRTACRQALIFVAFGLTAPLALTFGLLRRGRELVWIGFGFAVLIHHQALGWLRERQMAGGRRERKRKRPRRFHGQLAAPVDKAGDFEARRLLGFRRRNPGRSPERGGAYVTITSPVQCNMPTGSPPFWCIVNVPATFPGRKKKM